MRKLLELPWLGLAFAAFFLMVGLRSLITRKPFVISERWIMMPGLILFISFVLLQLWEIFTAFSLAQRPDLPTMSWLLPTLGFGFLFLYILKKTRGYSAYGVTAASMREGLLAALANQGIESEESLGVLKLPALGAVLKVET